MLSLVPHVMTPMFSVERIVLHASIMSESLTLPLFLLFLVFCHKMMMGGNIISPMLLSVLLSLIRSQFMAAILIWLVLAVISCVKRGKKLLPCTAVLVLVTLLLFTVRLYGVKTYNYIFSGHFINNTYGGVNTLTNVLYAADREDGDAIKDVQAQEIFYLLYDKMEEEGWNYKFAGEGLREKTSFLESCHDDLKFSVIEDTYLNYFRERGITDYYEQNLRADSISMTIMKEILPECFGRWLSCYLMLGIRGMIRSIGVYHPIVNMVVLLLYLVAFLLMVLDLKKDSSSKEGWLMFISLLSILAVAFSTAITIMCLSRYMIYNFIGFYVGLFLLIIKKMKERGVLTWVIKN